MPLSNFLVDYIFILKASNATLNPNPNEVMSVKYVSKEELKELFASAGTLITLCSSHVSLFRRKGIQNYTLVQINRWKLSI